MKRIIIIHWNKSTGPEPLIQYPPEKEFPDKDLFLKIWAQHELNKENSFIELEDQNKYYLSLIQEFESEIYFLVLVLERVRKKEEVISPDILAIIGKNLIELMNTNKITRAISEAFNTIKNYNQLESEDLVNFFHDKIKFTILQILRNGVISKTDLTNLLRQDYGFSTVNIDLLLISYIRENLIMKKFIPGSKECYFLINDLTIARIPPLKIPEEETIDERVLKKYKKEFVKFYSNYNCSQELENKTLINFLIDKDVYSLIKSLREENMSINHCLIFLNNKQDLFDELIEKKIIYEAKGVVYLFSDIRFLKFPPFYIIKTLIDRYNSQEISLNQFLQHTKLLLNRLKDQINIFNYSII